MADGPSTQFKMCIVMINTFLKTHNYVNVHKVFDDC